MRPNYAQENKQLAHDYLLYIERDLNFSESTRRTYKYIVSCYVHYLDETDIRSVTLQEVSDFLAGIEHQRTAKALGASTKNTYRSILRSYFQYVDRYRGIRMRFDYSMLRNARTSRSRINVMSLEDIMERVDKLESKQDKLMYITMFSAGLRVSELVGLQYRDIRTCELNVRGKGSKDRVIPIPEDLCNELEQHCIENGIRSGAIFRAPYGDNHPYTVSGYRKRLQRLLSDLYVKPHDARHSYATLMLMSGWDLRSLQTALGHSNIATTQIYTHITDVYLRESHSRCWPKEQFKVHKLVDNSA